MKQKNLYGLVLTGGQSSRMKKDKASLEFYGKKQSIYAYELLENFCENVFFSLRKEQAPRQGLQGYPQIHDEENYLGKGPIAGLLSAFKQFSKASWLVLACDLPFVDEETISYLIKNRSSDDLATAYKSVHDGLPEPLCAIYETQSAPFLLEHFNAGNHCPRKFLINHPVKIIEAENLKALNNINMPSEFEDAVKNIKNHAYKH